MTPGLHSMRQILKQYGRGSGLVMALKETINSRQWINAWINVLFTDGLPAEFYKTFWSDISDALIAALNFAYEIGKLPITQRRGTIKLIPKKETDLKNIKNWRPLSLLNCDYKIAAESTANRIQATLPKLINIQ